MTISSCEHLQKLCVDIPVSTCLKKITSKKYYYFLDALDEFEKNKNLQELKAYLSDIWPFPTYGPKRDTRSKSFERIVDEDIAAVFLRLIPNDTLGKKDLLHPQILNVILLYNLLVRRGLDVDVNTLKLHYAMHCLAPFFVDNFNIRWFISYCDSISDCSLFDEKYRLRAAIASTVLQGLKIYASTFKIAESDGSNLLEHLIAIDKERLPLGYGMITYWYKGGDVISNYLERSLRLVGQEELLGMYFHKAIHAFIFCNPGNDYLYKVMSETKNELHKSKISEIKMQCEKSIFQLNHVKNKIPVSSDFFSLQFCKENKVYQYLSI